MALGSICSALAMFKLLKKKDPKTIAKNNFCFGMQTLILASNLSLTLAFLLACGQAFSKKLGQQHENHDASFSCVCACA